MIKRIGDIIVLQLSDLDSNIYLIGDKAIDTGTGFNFTRMYSLLETLKIKEDNIKEIVNTHCHFDHVGGNGYFLEAKICIHEIEAPVLEQGDDERSVAGFFDGKLNPHKVTTKLKGGDTIKMGKYVFEVMHTPGHTPGSICLYDKSAKLLIAGDTLFENGVGRTDLPGGDANQLKESLEKLSKLKVDKILPGHGNPVLSGGNKVIQKAIKMAGTMTEDEESDTPI